MRRPVVYMLVAVLLSSLVTAVAALAVTRREQAENDRRWCALLVDLDSAYQSSPRPTSETGKKVAAEIHKLRVGFGCPEK